jgi:putative phosphoribosyl transferase
MTPERFRDRYEAGRPLAAKLAAYADRTDVIVLALPRGGVPVAHEVAQALNAPLDVFVVRKLGVPRVRGAGNECGRDRRRARPQ